MDYLKLFENHNNYEDFVSGGTMVRPNVSHCIEENEVHYNPRTWTDEYLTFVASEDGTFTFTPNNNNVISYSTDNGTTWTEGNSVEVINGDKVMWRGEMTPGSGREKQIGTFSSTCLFDAMGNVMSLLYGDNFKEQTDLTGKNEVFAILFSPFSTCPIVNAKNLILPATTLADGCYASMFRGCRTLTTAPELPATTLAYGCYRDMFNDCTSLTTAPELPATELAEYCYRDMFSNCTSLTTAPELPAITLANYCYSYMFYGCTSLTTAPKLPAITLAKGCYSGMLYSTNVLPDCSNIDFTSSAVISSCGLSGLFEGTKVTDNDLMQLLPLNGDNKYCLPVTTLANSCYLAMFRDCTSLTTAPELPATTLASQCYQTMFYGCTNLTSITCLATDISAADCTSYWVSNVASSGTFIKAANMASWPTGMSGIPNGWTVQDAS